MKQVYLSYKLHAIALLCFFTHAVSAQTCQLNISVSTSDSKCKATGSIIVTASNGSGNYNYTVTGGSFNTNTSSNTIDGLQPGTYTVKVKDITTGCTVEQTNVVVGGSYQDIRFNLAVTDVSCVNASDGSVTATNIQYGRGPFTCTIVAPSASHIGASNSSGVFTGLSAGDYYVQLADSCGGLQTRVIAVANYSWSASVVALSKPTCDSVDVTVAASDNKGNSNASGSTFNGFTYGVTLTPGDTAWSASRSFRFYKGTYRRATIVVKDGCGNIQTLPFTDTAIPNVNANVSISNRGGQNAKLSKCLGRVAENESFFITDQRFLFAKFDQSRFRGRATTISVKKTRKSMKISNVELLPKS